MYAYGPQMKQQGRRCPLCRGTIPPSQEEIARIKMLKQLLNGASDPDYEKHAREIEQFEAEYGEDWESTMIEYSNDFVNLPWYVVKAAHARTVLQWLGKGNIKDRVNAKSEDTGNFGLLSVAVVNQQHDLMSYLLLNGADVSILESSGGSVLAATCFPEDYSKTTRLLLSWGAELFQEGKLMTEEQKLALCLEIYSDGNIAIAKLMSSDLGGRRCEIVRAPNTRGYLVGKTCVVEEYLEESDQYKVKMEFTNEVLLLGADCLKRRDRTPRDPGYYVECKNNRLIRRDFKSNEECQAFVTTLCADEEALSEVDPEKEEAKAEQAAADLLAELGMGDLEGPSSSATKKEKESVPATGKKKKRGGKKKGRK